MYTRTTPKLSQAGFALLDHARLIALLAIYANMRSLICGSPRRTVACQNVESYLAEINTALMQKAVAR